MRHDPDLNPGPLQVLVVDDDRTTRLWTCRQVAQCGHVPLAADSGQAAVALCHAQEIDVVFMDILVPGMSGFDAALAIKALHTQCWVPVVFLSGPNEEGTRDHLTEAGNDFLSKPVDPQLLKAKLRSLSVAIGHERALGRFARQMEQAKQLARKLMGNMEFQFKRMEAPWLRVFNSEVGIGSGDCVAVEQMNGRVLWAVADATGHGLAAAFSLIPAVSVFRAMAAKGFGVADIEDEIQLKLRSMLPRDRFVAAVLADIDVTARIMSVLNAGLPAGLLSGCGGVMAEFASVCPPLNVQGQTPYARAVATRPLARGQQLLLGSDGLSDVCQPIPLPHVVAPLQAQASAELLGVRLWGECLSRMPQDDATLVCQTLDELLDPPPSQGFVHLSVQQLKASDVGADSVLEALALQGWTQAPHDAKLMVVLSELLANATEHGVLGLSSSLKEPADDLEVYEQERRRRLAALQEGFVDIRLRRLVNEPALELEVSDSGDGFDVSAHDDPDAPMVAHSALNGRGLSLLYHLCESVCYADGGRRVTVRIGVDELFV